MTQIYKINLTLTSQTGISVVGTVMVADSTVGTVNESSFSTVAKQVIQENRTSALPKSGVVKHAHTCKMIIHNSLSTTHYNCA